MEKDFIKVGGARPTVKNPSQKRGRGLSWGALKTNPPAHPVWKSKLALLAWIINKAIDNGNYDLPIDEVRKAANDERVIQFIRDSLPTHSLLDLSGFTSDDVEAVNHWFMGLNGNQDIYVENQGLCLLLAWTIEMMQHAGDPEDFT